MSKGDKQKKRTPQDRWEFMRERLGQLVMNVAVDAAGDTILVRADYYPRMTQIDPESVDRAIDEAIDRAEEAEASR